MSESNTSTADELTSGAGVPASEAETGLIQTPPSPAKRILRTVGWVFFALFCLITFTLLKLPDDRIKNYVQGTINAALAPKGISMTAGQGRVTVGFGISYVMNDVTLSLPAPDAPAHIDKVIVSPSLLGMLIGRMGGKAWIYNGDGTLTASYSMRKTSMSGSFTAKAVDLGKLGVLPLAAGIRGSALATGEGSLDGDLNVPSTLSGNIRLDLSKIVLDQQAIQGFSVPRLAISEGKTDIDINGGKAIIKAFQLGKPGSATDDVRATVTGDVSLGKQWDSSTLNAKATFSVSENVKKSFVLLDALLGAAKQADGSYAYQLNGSVFAPIPTPIAGGAPPAEGSAPGGASGR